MTLLDGMYPRVATGTDESQVPHTTLRVPYTLENHSLKFKKVVFFLAPIYDLPSKFSHPNPSRGFLGMIDIGLSTLCRRDLLVGHALSRSHQIIVDEPQDWRYKVTIDSLFTQYPLLSLWGGGRECFL